ncbi:MULTISPECIES: phytanoyl-CoA dioxygenase family protein [Prochlorococcus]|uniref:MmcH n=1 Tax=Prochlorococcus marinus str. MIT 9314 TaxID=167548 RepID=A0A0A2AEI8_PROMR|nr:phytanoyl-CoA dioxygenase family protein [Prochlorococcus marinus]KGG00293.1 MmcH [Prochlorococcus marinus str. MIT 9314]
MGINYIEPKIYEVFDDEAESFFSDEGFIVMKLDISLSSLKKAREKIIKIASKEEESGDSCFYENRNNEDGNIKSEIKKLQRIWNILNKDKLFHEFPLCGTHKKTLNKIFARNTLHNLYTISSFQANILYPGAEKQKIHVDTPVPEPLPEWPIKITTINLLDDFTADNGATMVVPKSHKSRLKPKPGTNDEQLLKTIIAPFGSSIFTHGGLWHASGTNQSNSKRLALLGSYAASYAKDIAYEENHIQIKNKLICFENDLAEMLGYNLKPNPGALNF